MPRKKVVGDTSSLVSLQLAGALEPSFAFISWVIPNAVVVELKELSVFDDAIGRAARKVFVFTRSRRFEVLSIQPLLSVLELADEGEACAFSLCLREKIRWLVCDDVDAGYRLDGLAQANGIRIVIGAAVIMELVKQKAWSKKQAAEAVLKMIDSRGWQGGVLEYLSRKYLQEG